MSENPANLAGIGNVKGQIAKGFDADFVIWDPHQEVSIADHTIHHKNKVRSQLLPKILTIEIIRFKLTFR